MEEIWKPIKGYEGYYEISTLGRIKSLKRRGCRNEFMLKQYVDDKGYKRHTLTKYGKSKRDKTHTVMAVTFLGHEKCGHKYVIDHINGDRSDNRIENLRIVTNRFNCTYGHRNLTFKKTSIYPGVCFLPSIRKWKAAIEINGKTKYLGVFENEESAHHAYQNELLKLNL